MLPSNWLTLSQKKPADSGAGMWYYIAMPVTIVTWIANRYMFSRKVPLWNRCLWIFSTARCDVVMGYSPAHACSDEPCDPVHSVWGVPLSSPVSHDWMSSSAEETKTGKWLPAIPIQACLFTKQSLGWTRCLLTTRNRITSVMCMCALQKLCWMNPQLEWGTQVHVPRKAVGQCVLDDYIYMPWPYSTAQLRWELSPTHTTNHLSASQCCHVCLTYLLPVLRSDSARSGQRSEGPWWPLTAITYSLWLILSQSGFRYDKQLSHKQSERSVWKSDCFGLGMRLRKKIIHDRNSKHDLT